MDDGFSVGIHLPGMLAFQRINLPFGDGFGEAEGAGDLLVGGGEGGLGERALGDIFLQFKTRSEMEARLADTSAWLKIILKQ